MAAAQKIGAPLKNPQTTLREQRFRRIKRNDFINMRATTDKQKEEIIRRLLECWKENPHQRLGQLIINGLTNPTISIEMVFAAEDETLVKNIELFTKKRRMDKVLK